MGSTNVGQQQSAAKRTTQNIQKILIAIIPWGCTEDECANEPDERISRYAAISFLFFFSSSFFLSSFDYSAGSHFHLRCNVHALPSSSTKFVSPSVNIITLYILDGKSSSPLNGRNSVCGKVMRGELTTAERQAKTPIQTLDNKQIRKLFTPLSLQDLLWNTMHPDDDFGEGNKTQGKQSERVFFVSIPLRASKRSR